MKIVQKSAMRFVSLAVALSSLALGFAAQPAHAACETPRYITIESTGTWEPLPGHTVVIGFKIHSVGCAAAGTITVTTGGGTATKNVDYANAGALQFSWAQGDLSDRVFTVKVFGDDKPELDETFNVFVMPSFSTRTNFDYPIGTAAVGTIWGDAVPR